MRKEKRVESTMQKEIDELSRMIVSQLRQKYLEARRPVRTTGSSSFGIAWRIQALAEGVVDRKICEGNQGGSRGVERCVLAHQADVAHSHTVGKILNPRRLYSFTVAHEPRKIGNPAEIHA